MAVVAAPLEVGYGNKRGVQLRHESYWSAALPTATLKQIRDLFCLQALSLSRCREGQAAGNTGGSQWCLCRGQPSSWGIRWKGRTVQALSVQSPCSGQMLLQHLSTSWSCGDHVCPTTLMGINTSVFVAVSDHTWVPGMADGG